MQLIDECIIHFANDPAPKEPGANGPMQGEVLTLGGALGAGWGAHVAIEAGAMAGAAAVGIGAAAVAGLFAAGIVGWNLGKIIGETPVVRDALQDLIDKVMKPADGEAPIVAPAVERDRTAWTFDMDGDGDGAPVDIGFYVGDPSEMQLAFEADFNDGGI